MVPGKVYGHKGSITVFISIILSSVFLVAGTFTDAARIKLAHSQVQRANQTALSSVLACYNNELKQQYGLFGLYLDSDTLNEYFEEYFSKNLNIGSQDLLYGYKVESINIEKPFSLEKQEVFESQIMEFMKYRAPAELASELVSKIEGIKNISKGSKVYRRKLETDKKASFIGELQMILEDKVKKINDLNLTKKLKDMKKQIVDNNASYQEVSAKLSKLYNLYSNEKSNKVKKNLLKEINSVSQELSNLSSKTAEIKTLIKENIESFKNINSQAMEDANKLTEQKGALLSRIEEELRLVEEDKEGIEDIQKAYGDSLSDMKTIVAEDNSDSIIGKLKTNIENCKAAFDKADGNEDEFLSAIELLCETGTINYTFNKAQPAASEDEDNRWKVAQELTKAFNQKGELKSIDKDLLERLPSRKSMLQDEKLHWDATDFNTTNGAEKELEFMADKENSWGNIALNITEELYINEYIMGIFRHDVPLLKNEEESKAYNLRSEDKFKRNSYFSSFEVEYIINGSKDEAVNSMLIKAEILTLRLAANVIHIYTDPSKMSRITGLAAALSSWNAGLSTPLLQTMLVFSWAMFESLYDQDQICIGEKIPLFKTKDQWKTDISGAVNNKKTITSDNNPFFLSYQDYLRIFLLLTDKEKKLARTQDLIQLNMGISCSGFSISDTYVALKADSVVSIKNLFFSIPAFTSKTRRNLARSNIEESMLLSY